MEVYCWCVLILYINLISCVPCSMLYYTITYVTPCVICVIVISCVCFNCINIDTSSQYSQWWINH